MALTDLKFAQEICVFFKHNIIFTEHKLSEASVSAKIMFDTIFNRFTKMYMNFTVCLIFKRKGNVVWIHRHKFKKQLSLSSLHGYYQLKTIATILISRWAI